MAKRKRNKTDKQKSPSVASSKGPVFTSQKTLPFASQAKVRKSNVFVDGRYRFNLQEQKILLQIISKVRMDEKEFSSYFVSWEELKEISNNYLDSSKKIDESCEKLKNKTIKIKTGNAEDNFGFLSGWTTIPGQGVHFRIDPSMKVMLLDLLQEGNFTLYNLECAMALNSSHSIRLYEVLKSEQWKKQPVVLSLDKIKWSLDIDQDSPTYSDFGPFRVHILEKSQKAFKKHTDIVFSFIPIKEGRRVVSLEITIKDNPQYQTTVQGKIAKESTKTLPSGSIIILGGVEYVFNGSVMYSDNGSFPASDVYRLLEQGKAKLKN